MLVLAAGFVDHGKVVTETEFRHGIHLSSAYASCDTDPTFIMPPHSHYRLDHVTFTPNTLALRALLQVLPDADRERILSSSLPLPDYPSDHMPVGAVFGFKLRA